MHFFMSLPRLVFKRKLQQCLPNQMVRRKEAAPIYLIDSNTLPPSFQLSLH